MREAIQNSVDERRLGGVGPVRFSVRRKQYLGDEKFALARKFGLKELAHRASVFPKAHGWFKHDETCLADLDDPDVALSALILSDHNTNGLGGSWNTTDGIDSRFYNLVLSIYASHKQDNANGLLGSYGVGKMVYAITSKIRTMAYYSSFEPTDLTEGVHTRFMATAFLPGHKMEGSDYTGHAFFGSSSGTDGYPSQPLTDANANEFAEGVGLELRSPNDTGLTVMLLDCDLRPEECREACEKFWWPRIVDEHSEEFVDLEFFDGETKLASPIPRDRIELKPFIDCFSNIRQGVNPDGYDCNRVKLADGGEVGHLCLKAIGSPEAKHNQLANSVALIRGGLVIEYNPSYAREDDPDAVGVFRATGGRSIKCFTLSEPEAHDEWNSSNSRLKRSLGQSGADLVRITHDRIKSSFRDFQTRQKNVTRNNTSEGLDFLDDILGPIFRKRKKGPPPRPVPARRAFTVHKSAWRDFAGESVVDYLDFAIALVDGVSLEPISCKVKAVLHVLEDADARRGATLPCTVLDDVGKPIFGGSGTFEVELTPNATLTFHASARVQPTWTTRWTVTVARSPSPAGEST